MTGLGAPNVLPYSLGSAKVAVPTGALLGTPLASSKSAQKIAPDGQNPLEPLPAAPVAPPVPAGPWPPPPLAPPRPGVPPEPCAPPDAVPPPEPVVDPPLPVATAPP